jgi:hypothetical protein
MTTFHRALVAAISLLLASQGPIALADIRTEWRAARYDDTFRDCEVFRKQEYGKRADVYYMAATSLCRLPGRSDLGVKYMEWITSNYPLTDADRRVVNSELAVCRAAAAPPAPAVVSIVARATASSQGSAKMFFGINGTNALLSVPSEVVRQVPPAEFAQRLFVPTSSAAAVRAARTRLSTVPGTQALTPAASASRRFIVASLDARPVAQLDTIARQLDTAFDFFVSEYGMQVPAPLITVYLVRDTSTMQRVADKLYGLRLSPQSIGFSFQDDLSMVGVVQTTAMGTLQHELFHLMVRNNFGDVPPWLDEGMAALYEESAVQAGRVVGLPNWRGQVLQRFGQEQPSIEALMTMDWFAFSAGGDDFRTIRQAAIHAKARYFVLFLQEQGRLAAVYKAFQARDIGSDPRAVLTSTLGSDLTAVERDFQAWLKTVQR